MCLECRKIFGDMKYNVLKTDVNEQKKHVVDNFLCYSDNMNVPVYLQGLNERQKEAVLQIQGPVLIVAGAGAGKTKTITHRILNLVHQGIAPNEILAITFTNKAAHEMRDRMEKLLQNDKTLNLPIYSADRPFISTFHSLGVHILRENAATLGFSRNFTIFDKSDSKRAIREAMEVCNIDPKQFDPGKIQNLISRQKGDGVTPTSFREKMGKEYLQSIIGRVWEQYESILRREKSLDFDDLLLRTLSLLQKNESVRIHYQNIWKYIHIDEYQDTNKVQYFISKILAEKNRNICVVGDVDQNIYSWRGADIQNLLSFEEDYPEAKVIMLEENYRSTKNILSVANTVIKKNKLRREKNLFTNNPVGEKIGLFEGYDESDEAYFVANKIRSLIENGRKAEEIAILYRANFQSRIIEEALLHYEIPYHVVGTRFYERKEIKDALSYVRGALNPDSLSDLKRIINVPARGIGKVTIAKMFSGQEATLPATTRAKIQNFRKLLAEIAQNVAIKKPSEIFTDLIKKTGMGKALDDGTDEGTERIENIKELVTLATKYDGLSLPTGIEKMLEEAALASDQDSLIKKQTDAVKVMTVHAAKGLEFDYVFITGLEENLFPHKQMGESKRSEQDDEEERRLFYVALTRARKKLFLCYASIRTIFGSKQMNIPSEFLNDVDEPLIEQEIWQKGEDRPFKTIHF
jgi:DNA helicase II / ATP-dependent DNA helicase PcrA